MNADNQFYVSTGIRLQKILADAGHGSRRYCEKLIEDGRVRINGIRIQHHGLRVDPTEVEITVDDEPIVLLTNHESVVFAFHKPIGVVSTMSDPEGRSCLGDYFSDTSERFFHVGRLDIQSEGLLFVTNDGDIAHMISHPRFGVHKTYVVEIDSRVTSSIVQVLRKGIVLDDGPVKVLYARILDSFSGSSALKVTITEGRNRIIRRMFEHMGLQVIKLFRTQIGNIDIGQLPPGKHRVLHTKELSSLLALCRKNANEA